MDVFRTSRPAAAILVAAAAALAGCSALPSLGGSSGGAPASGGGGSTLSNLLRYGSTTEPPIARDQVVEAQECPSVSVADGGAALRRGSIQISIANVARECIERPGGAIVVKVGVEGRALLGAGGASGRFDVPIAFAIKRGDRVIVSRVRRVAVSIPPNDSQASFVAVEPDLVVPPGTGEYEIEVGLGGEAMGARSRRR